MLNVDEIISSFIILWAVIDPIGTLPVFIAVTKGYDISEKKKIANNATIISFFILLFFLVVGEILLRKMGVPLAAFQTSGGIILFLFAINMIFGDSKPEEELQLAKDSNETAVFPLSVPSIAGPGAILAVVLLTDNSRHSMISQVSTVGVLIVVLTINLIIMRLSSKIDKKIGRSGAIIISKVMGLILASMAATNVLDGIRDYFKIT